MFPPCIHISSNYLQGKLFYTLSDIHFNNRPKALLHYVLYRILQVVLIRTDHNLGIQAMLLFT